MVRIVFGAADDFRSALIRWATGSQWSHVWFEYPSTVWGSTRAAHASDQGVVVEPAARVQRRFTRLEEFAPQGIDLTRGLKKSNELIGRKYDFKVIWNCLLFVLYRKTKWEFLWNLAIRDLSRFTCSEFVATVLRRAQVPGAESLDPELSPPEAVYRFCVDSLQFRQGSETKWLPPKPPDKF